MRVAAVLVCLGAVLVRLLGVTLGRVVIPGFVMNGRHMVMFRRLVMVLRGTDVMGAGRMLCCHAVRFPSLDIKFRRAAGPWWMPSLVLRQRGRVMKESSHHAHVRRRRAGAPLENFG